MGEKAFTTNKKLKGPDQAASVLPRDFSEMVNCVNKATDFSRECENLSR